MNQQTLMEFWGAVPPVMKLILGVFLGATVHFLRNRAVPLVEGLTGALTSAITGFLLTYGLCYWKGIDMGELWFVGAGLTFMANFFLGGMETVGNQFRSSPIKWIIETGLDAYDVVKARLKPKQ